MGRGLIEPVDDMEKTAWNPDLLDWLAEDLAAHDYDVKHMVAADPDLARLPTAGGGPRANSTQQDYVFRGPAVRRLSGGAIPRRADLA